MKRRDWTQRFLAYVEETRDWTPKLGERDCALWTAGALDVMCDSDLAAEFRGRYGTEAEAEALMASRGWHSLYDVARELVGEPTPRGALVVEMGDVVYCPSRHVGSIDGALGILLGQVHMPDAERGVRPCLFSAVMRMGGVVFPIPMASEAA